MSMTTQRLTALITGASGGIGEELAQVFARHQYNLVVLARTAAKLDEVGQRLATQYGCQIHTMVADLADPATPQRIATELAERGQTVDVLVNNAGFGTYGPLVDSDLTATLQMLQVNVVALTELTHRLVPAMLTNRRGRILNVASTAAFMPGPLMSVYYASKAYVLSFSEALHEELRGTGVTVTALCPGPTRSGFQARAAMETSRLVRGPLMMTSQAVAEAGFAALMRGDPLVIPGWMNRIQALGPRLLPRRIVPGIVRRAQERVHPHR